MCGLEAVRRANGANPLPEGRLVMRRIVIVVAAAALAGASAASAAAPVRVTPTVVAYPAGGPTPAALPASQSQWLASFFGAPVVAGGTVPGGVTILDVTAQITTGQTTRVTTTCPSGSGMAAFMGTTDAYAATNTVGQTSTTFSYGTSNPTGTDEFFVFCVPIASVTQKLLRPRAVSPITATGTLTKGKRLPEGKRLVRVTVQALAAGTPAIVPITCQRGADVLYSSSQALNVKEWITGPNTGLIVSAPAASTPTTAATTFYAVCAPLPADA
jgi:hypothetical protein